MDHAPVCILWLTAYGVHPGLRTDFCRDQIAQGRSWKPSYLDLRLCPHLSWFIFSSRSTHVIPVVRVFDSRIVGGLTEVTRFPSRRLIFAVTNVIFSVSSGTGKRTLLQSGFAVTCDMEPGLECIWSRIQYVQERDTKDCFRLVRYGCKFAVVPAASAPYPTCQRHAAELPRMISLTHTSTRSMTIFTMLLTVVILKVQVMFKAIRSKLTYVGGIIAKT